VGGPVLLPVRRFRLPAIWLAIVLAACAKNNEVEQSDAILRAVRVPPSYHVISGGVEKRLIFKLFLAPPGEVGPETIVLPPDYEPVNEIVVPEYAATFAAWLGPSPGADSRCAIYYEVIKGLDGIAFRLSMSEKAAVRRGVLVAVRISASCIFAP
jgi:hypothetical protein